MLRDAMRELVRWKDSPIRKPLVVTGARQVGKTWLVSEFGSKHFESMAHVIFLDNEEIQAAFSTTLDPDRLLTSIGIATGTNPADGKTLVFLDEIQECPRAMTSLKLFCEKRPDVPIVAAGSLLGVAMNREPDRSRDSRQAASMSWPVGKVEYLDMHPMTFPEFLQATGEAALSSVVRECDFAQGAVFAQRLAQALRTYLFVGGMPEAVLAHAANPADYASVRTVQERLLRDYEYDFSKHVEHPSDIERIRQTWRSVPRQLATESDNKRFAYSKIRSGGRGRDYKDAVAWLEDAGLVTKVPKVSAPQVPLESYVDDTYFKLYHLDVGLLGAATQLDARSIIEGNSLFTHFKGAYAEQYVCQSIVARNGFKPYYWSADGKRAKGEVDFVVSDGRDVWPLEVKAEKNVHGSSIAALCRDYGLKKGIRFSMRDYKDQGWLVNYPLAFASSTEF